jgi:hypothetical protein
MQRRIDRGDLAVDLAQALLGLTLEQGRAVRMASVAGGDAVLDQGAAGNVQLLHGVEGRAHDRPHRRLQERREAGEHGGVDRVGLSMLADRLGEAPRLAGIDLDQGQTGRGQPALEGVVIGAGGLPLRPVRESQDRKKLGSRSSRS